MCTDTITVNRISIILLILRITNSVGSQSRPKLGFFSCSRSQNPGSALSPTAIFFLQRSSFKLIFSLQKLFFLQKARQKAWQKAAKRTNQISPSKEACLNSPSKEACLNSPSKQACLNSPSKEAYLNSPSKEACLKTAKRPAKKACQKSPPKEACQKSLPPARKACQPLEKPAKRGLLEKPANCQKNPQKEACQKSPPKEACQKSPQKDACQKIPPTARKARPNAACFIPVVLEGGR